MKKFISFADSRMQPALERIASQAEAMQFFDEIRVFDERHLGADFLNRWGHIVKCGVRGYGYWCWKSYLILRELESMQEGDQLYYCDAGCHLNPGGRERLADYSEMLAACPLGILAFELEELEYKWTKADVLAYFGLDEKPEALNSPQVCATHVLVRKCESSVRFMQEWIQAWETDFSRIDDTPSRIPNHPEFRDHRHDQSLFSCLLKKHSGAAILSFRETEPVGLDWTKMKKYPFLDIRDRGKGARVKRKLRRYRFMAGLPLGPISRYFRKKAERVYNNVPYIQEPLPYMRPDED